MDNNSPERGDNADAFLSGSALGGSAFGLVKTDPPGGFELAQPIWNGTTPIPREHIPILLGLPLYDRLVYLRIVDNGRVTSKKLREEFQSPEEALDLSETRKSKSTLNQALERLQKLRFVRKDRDPRDRRGWLYSVVRDLETEVK